MKKLNSSSGAAWLADFAIYLILGATPLFFNYFYPTSIDLSKIVFFKVFTLLLFFAVVWRLFTFKISFIKDSWKSLLPLILLFSFLILSLPVSVDITTSWFGSYDRQEGLVSWLFYGLWALLLVIHLNCYPKAEIIDKIAVFFKVISWSGLIVSVYAILQIIGFDFVTWAEPASVTGRAVSFLGQPNYLACWLVLVMPFTAYLILKSQNNINRIIWVTIFFAELVALLMTGSRAVFFVFLLVSVFWLIWFLSRKKILSRRTLLIIIFSGIVIIGSFLGFLAISNKARLEEFTDFKKGSAAVRLELWKTGTQAYLNKPWLGYGLENQPEAYVHYYKSDWALYARPDTYSDRAHNLILDVLLTSGFIGLLFFGYFIYFIFSNLIKALKDTKYQDLSAFLLWSLIAYLVSLLFNFSVIITNIYFWFLIALSFVITGKALIVVETDEEKPSLARIILVLGAAVLFFGGSIFEFNKLSADYYFYKLMPEITKGEYFTALVFKDYLDATHPDKSFSDYYNRSVSLRFLESLPMIKDRSSVMAIKNYLTATEKDLPDSTFENNFTKAFIFGGLGNRYEFEKMFNNLSSSSPELPKIYLAWGDSLMSVKDYKGAIIKFEKAFSLLPDSENPYLSADQRKSLDAYKAYVKSRLYVAELLKK
jgi:O-antigen ligase